MEEKQLVDAINHALKASGFARVQKQVSSRSITLSAYKDERTVVVHIADPEPPPGPRSGINQDVPDADDIFLRAHAPTLEVGSGSGSEAPPTPTRKKTAR